MPSDLIDRELLQGVNASVIVPASSTYPVDEILQNHPEIEQRTKLYFDESLRIFVLLDFPACPEDRIKVYLEKLEIRVDAWVVSTQNGDAKTPVDNSSTRDLIASESLSNLEDPVTLVKHDEEDDNVRLLFAWEIRLTLARPRIRSPEQSVTFLPIATIVNSDRNEDPDEFLEPFVVQEPNLLEVVDSPPGAPPPFLPISRLEKMLPSTPKKDDRIRLRHHASKPIRAFAAVMPRLKYNKINTFLPEPTTIASLDLEMTPFTDVSGRIEKVEVSMTNGRAMSLMPGFLPMSCKSRDCITFLYELQPIQQSGASDVNGSAIQTTIPSTLNISILSIKILISLFLSPTTVATITTSWTTNIDFSLALNPAFGAPSQNIQRTNRPSSLNFTPYADHKKTQARDVVNIASARTASTSLQHQIIPTSIPRQAVSSILSISFIGLDKPARPGVPFSWRVLIVNNSPKVAKLAIVPLPRIQRPTNANQHYAKRHAPKASNSTLQSSSISTMPANNSNKEQNQHSRNAGGGSIAKAVVEEHILYALHHQASSAGAAAVPAEADIISLTAELRIGPLGVKQCHETEIRFIAYKAGVFNLDAIRVVDLTKETENGVGAISDVRELPEIVVEDE